MSRPVVTCEKCSKRVSVSKIGKLAFHKAFVPFFGMSVRMECPGAGKIQALPSADEAEAEAADQRIRDQDREFAEFGDLAIIKVDTYLECYHGSADKSPRHYDGTLNRYVSDNGAYERAESALRSAAPGAYQGSGIKLSVIWKRLDAETRAYVLRDIAIN